jgi:superfamily II DNA or RNA helicase
MGWLNRVQKGILSRVEYGSRSTFDPELSKLRHVPANDLHIISHSFRVDSSQIPLSAQATRLGFNQIQLPAQSTRLGSDQIQLSVHSSVENTEIDAACKECETTIPVTGPRICPVYLDTSATDVRLEFSCTALAPIIGYAFTPTVYRFSFMATPREPASLFSPRNMQPRSHGLVAPVTPLPSPPPHGTSSLEERLRLLLTPPIHEILSDPQLCLPEKPYPYQTMGIKWLYDREYALLADEMGLGKTMQAIIAARLLYREGMISQVLVVCPKTLIPNWQTELRMWWPQVSNNISVADSDRQWFLRLGTSRIVVKIINYEALAREVVWLKTQKFTHDLIIIDEAQRIKNPRAKTALAVKSLRGERRWAMTGTPLENKADDLVSVFEFLKRGVLRYGSSNDTIREAISPHLLRRKTEEVLPDLPEKIEQDIEVELEGEQRKAYDRAETEGVVELNAKGDKVTITHVFALITKLRQICNFEPVSGESSKVAVLCEDIEEIVESDRKALVFSQFVAEDFGIARISRILKEKQWGPLELHGRIPQGSRTAVVKKFTTDQESRVLLLNYAVGGVGLNLQAANYVYLFDRWWNPAVEDQAVKRAHRIGQKSKVFVRRFFCKNTIEERILKKLREKRRLFSHIIDEGRPDQSMGLSEEEIFSLFNLKVRPRVLSKPTTPVPIILENLDPTEFENLVAVLYEKQGYQVTVLAGSHDQGIDILAEKAVAGGKERVAVQCKHVQDNVGRPVLQQLWGVVCHDASITRGDLVTSAGFTREAKDFSHGKRVGLIDLPQLQQLVREFKVAKFVADTADKDAKN